eukprot:SAG11_NODE_1031_length_6111_cov_2.587159_10_plen_106_part_00
MHSSGDARPLAFQSCCTFQCWRMRPHARRAKLDMDVYVLTGNDFRAALRAVPIILNLFRAKTSSDNSEREEVRYGALDVRRIVLPFRPQKWSRGAALPPLPRRRR